MFSMWKYFARRPVTALGAMAVAGCVVSVSTPASAQNFLQQLFGGGPSYQRPAYEGRSYYGPSGQSPQTNYLIPNQRRAVGAWDPSDPNLRRAMHHRAKAATADGDGESGGSKGRMTSIAPTPEAPMGSLALFMKDKTLRAGDVVVTNAGFRVYEGSSGGKKKSDDFAAINSTSTPKSDRAALTKLEQVSRMRTPNTTVETVAVAKPVAPAPEEKKKTDKVVAQKSPDKGSR